MRRRSLQFVLLALALLCLGLTTFFWVKGNETRRLLDQFTDEALAGVPRDDVDAVVMALSRQVFARTNRGLPPTKLSWYERWESTSFFNVTTGASIKLGIYGVEGHSQFGPCGTMSRVLLNALWRLDIPARKLQLISDTARGFVNHTMVEYYSRGQWRVISPSDSSFVWRDAGGDIATLDEIRSDPGIRDEIHVRRADWPASFDHTSHIRWEKLPAPIRRLARVALGPQRYESAQTPRIYDQPRRLFRLLFGCGTAVFLGLALVVRPPRRKAPPGSPGDAMARDTDARSASGF